MPTSFILQVSYSWHIVWYMTVQTFNSDFYNYSLVKLGDINWPCPHQGFWSVFIPRLRSNRRCRRRRWNYHTHCSCHCRKRFDTFVMPLSMNLQSCIRETWPGQILYRMASGIDNKYWIITWVMTTRLNWISFHISTHW